MRHVMELVFQERRSRNLVVDLRQGLAMHTQFRNLGGNQLAKWVAGLDWTITRPYSEDPAKTRSYWHQEWFSLFSNKVHHLTCLDCRPGMRHRPLQERNSGIYQVLNKVNLVQPVLNLHQSQLFLAYSSTVCH